MRITLTGEIAAGLNRLAQEAGKPEQAYFDAELSTVLATEIRKRVEKITSKPKLKDSNKFLRELRNKRLSATIGQTAREMPGLSKAQINKLRRESAKKAAKP